MVVQRKAVNCWGILMKCIVIILLVIPSIPSLVCWCHSDPEVATCFFNLFIKKSDMYTTTQFLIETHQSNLYLISSSPWSLLPPGPLQFHSLSLPSSSFQPAPPWTGSLFSSNWILPSPSFLAAAPSDLSLPLTPPTTYRLTGYPAGFSGEIPFFLKDSGDQEVGCLAQYSYRCSTLSFNI